VIVSDAVFESAGDVDTVVLDKTGTLTDGAMRLVDSAVVDEDAGEERVLERAAALERASAHPVAAAIVGAVDPASGESPVTDGGVESTSGVDRPREPEDGRGARRRSDPEGLDGGDVTAADVMVTDVTVTDRGVRGRIDGDRVVVGHRSLFAGPEWSLPDRLATAGADAESAGHVPVYVGWNGAVRGVLVVGDAVRDGWEDLVEELDARGKRVVVLTGDSTAAARRFEEHPAIDEVFAEVPPEAKAETVRRLGATEQVAMVGDGSNDAPALAAADLGISIASGTDLAADAADAVLLEDRLSAIPELFDVTAGTNRRLKENLGWAFVYNGVAIPLAITGALNPLLAALAMGASSLLVVSNSARPVFDAE